VSDVAGSTLKAVVAFAVVYFLVVNTWRLVLLALAAVDVTRQRKAVDYAGYGDLFASPMMPAVSIVVAGRGRAEGVVESVRALLALRYPTFEVIVVDDGSGDGAFVRLREAFDLVEIPKVVPALVPVSGQVRSVHVPARRESLIVVRTAGHPTEADVHNTAVNVARHPLVCFVEPHTLLEPDALLRTAKPFFDDPLRTVVVGGAVQAVNGSRVDRGRVETRTPRSWLVRIQVVELLRSSLFDPSGWARLRCLLTLPDAFALYRRSALIEVGGLPQGATGAGEDLLPRIHRRLCDRQADYRVAFVAEPVGWTEVPEQAGDLARRRRRRARSLAGVAWAQRRMVAPRYGRVGLLALPHTLVVELLGPLVELAGLVAAVVGLAAGAVALPLVELLVLVTVGYGTFLSIASLALEEVALPGHGRRTDLATDVAAAVVANVGFRQWDAWWRVRGLVDALTRRAPRPGRPSRAGARAQAEGPELAVPPFLGRGRPLPKAGAQGHGPPSETA
jgi:GT2 family glycosyltransferase